MRHNSEMMATGARIMDHNHVFHFLYDNPGLSILAISCIIGFSSILQSIVVALKPGIRSIPGPFLARFSKLHRMWHISKGNAPVFYRELHEKYGPIVRTGPATVDISDPAAITTIYGISSKFLKSAFYDVFSPWLDDTRMASMFSTRDPAYHQALKRSVSQKFSMSSIKSLEPFADECSDIFIQAMKDLEGTPVDLSTWLQWYAFDVIGAITFQRRFGFMEKRTDIRNMIGDIDLGLRIGATFGQIPDVHPWLLGNLWVLKFFKAQPFIKLRDPLYTVVEFTKECMSDYDCEPAEKHASRPDFLAWLRGEETKGKPMSDRDMINHLSNNLLAGSDTTAISLRAIIYYLVKTPRAYKKLQQEIDAADKAGKLSNFVTYAECLELPYLQAVIKEAMRCHPGVSFPLERLVPEGGLDVCGVHLQPGTVVGMNAAVMHYDKSIFGDDAALFRPERWTESDAEHIKFMDRHLMTFGYGSRTCIGKNISIMEMGKLIPLLMRYFDIEWASSKPEWRIETFWFSKQHDMICSFKSRSKA